MYVCMFYRKQAQAARVEAEKDGITVPLTLEDYCIKTKVKPQTTEPSVEMGDIYDDDYDELDDDDDEEDEDDDLSDGFKDGDDNDSGNGES